ncbi:hypothetical protein dsat_0346 [Alkalidesulfovibrio alkalitolerans DSM 16529]|jgi:phage shock protein B|uniref:Phage shock protein B n=1 Tax=Alkalidesulfovibrio alkalitolerans DSM 16529 TaxID=1121439 RepID=S7T8S6_9BACT|nr:hypothetical protein [Alkalidesulfovibrio alkalitolerans]EPR32905.1 hypothetical protein dsat_0346 [Alkalidesulfovibrio alkalitolerans DSM 16529]
MHADAFVTELFTTLRLILVFAFIFGVIWLFRGRTGKSSRDEEARLAQELHQGMERLEKRVDSLETLLMEREKPHER